VSLFSGSVTFLNSSVSRAANLPESLAIAVVDHHFHGQLRNGRPSGLSMEDAHHYLIWTGLRHEVIGGSTHYVALFCASEELNPLVTTLR
jgi:hypothetical protein